MNITVFTSNQPRHLSLINDLSKIADTVYAVIEVNTIFPGEKADFFKKSDVMQEYFSHVMASEKNVFGNISVLPKNVRPIIMKVGDLSSVSLEVLEPCLNSNKYVVFGASYIKGELIDFLVDHDAYNIHMGVSPFYRGSSCNFWAAYDGNYEMVGATIHMLSKGLDSGAMLFHALPGPEANAFDLGMRAVKSAHKGLVENIANGTLDKFEKVIQDKSQEIRYTKNSNFDDEVAQDYLNNLPTEQGISDAIENMDLSKFLNPYVY